VNTYPRSLVRIWAATFTWCFPQAVPTSRGPRTRILLVATAGIGSDFTALAAMAPWDPPTARVGNNVQPQLFQKAPIASGTHRALSLPTVAVSIATSGFGFGNRSRHFPYVRSKEPCRSLVFPLYAPTFLGRAHPATSRGLCTTQSLRTALHGRLTMSFDHAFLPCLPGLVRQFPIWFCDLFPFLSHLE